MQASLNALLKSSLSQKPRREVDMDSESSESVDESVKGAEVSAAATRGAPSEVAGPVEPATVEPNSKPGNGAEDGVKAPSESASNGDGTSPKKSAEVKQATKHVKRSSFFGGIFG